MNDDQFIDSLGTRLYQLVLSETGKESISFVTDVEIDNIVEWVMINRPAPDQPSSDTPE